MKKILLILIIMVFGLYLVGCNNGDYGYLFHFHTDGGNGKITVKTDISEKSIFPCNKELHICDLDCPEGSYVAQLLGGKKGSRELTFLAIPDANYQVKEWLFNGKVVEGNKTNEFTAKVSSDDNYNGVIIVRFELIK